VVIAMFAGSKIANLSVLLTGASGFLGQHLALSLAKCDVDLNILTRRPLVFETIARRGTQRLPTQYECEVFEEAALNVCLAGRTFDLIINAAAYGVVPSDRDPTTMEAVNSDLPLWLATHALKSHGQFISIGSSAEYCHTLPAGIRYETDALESERYYGASKAKCSQRLTSFARRSEAIVTHLRLFNLFGPNEAEHRLFRSLARQLGLGIKVPLSPGTQVRDFISVSDTIDAILTIAGLQSQTPGSIRIANICTGQGHSVADFARSVARALDAEEALLDFGALPMRPDDVDYLIGSPLAAEKLFNWRASLDLDQAIKMALQPDSL
jgi:nucleoside-diphosphate-sugar epimerase